MTIDLANKNVLVTGASRGIGRAIAEVLGECGAQVAVHYFRNEKKAEKVVETIGRAKSFQADLNNPAETVELFKNVADAFDQIHVVVNNAGISLYSPIAGSDEDFIKIWQETMEVNLNSMGLLCKKIYRALFATWRREDNKHHIPRGFQGRHQRLYGLCGIEGRHRGTYTLHSQGLWQGKYCGL